MIVSGEYIDIADLVPSCDLVDLGLIQEALMHSGASSQLWHVTPKNNDTNSRSHTDFLGTDHTLV